MSTNALVEWEKRLTVKEEQYEEREIRLSQARQAIQLAASKFRIQQESDINFVKTAIDGQEFDKLGRNLKLEKRTLWFNPHTLQICWDAPEKSKEEKTGSGSDSSVAHHTQKPKHYVSVWDIKDVVYGFAPNSLFQKYNSKLPESSAGHMQADNCFSIILPDRTLDLSHDSRDICEKWVVILTKLLPNGPKKDSNNNNTKRNSSSSNNNDNDNWK